MPTLLRMTNRPKITELGADEQTYLKEHFAADNAEIRIDDIYVDWARIDEVEIAKAARSGASGWLVKALVYGGDERYHLALYYGRHEAVLPNITLATARYVLQTIAYFTRHGVRYKGPEGLAPLSEA